jgi:hypothetical protein
MGLSLAAQRAGMQPNSAPDAGAVAGGEGGRLGRRVSEQANSPLWDEGFQGRAQRVPTIPAGCVVRKGKVGNRCCGSVFSALSRRRRSKSCAVLGAVNSRLSPPTAGNSFDLQRHRLKRDRVERGLGARISRGEDLGSWLREDDAMGQGSTQHPSWLPKQPTIDKQIVPRVEGLVRSRHRVHSHHRRWLPHLRAQHGKARDQTTAQVQDEAHAENEPPAEACARTRQHRREAVRGTHEWKANAAGHAPLIRDRQKGCQCFRRDGAVPWQPIGENSDCPGIVSLRDPMQAPE